MAESWVERLKRESREMDASVRELIASMPADDKDLRDKLEALAQKPRFAEFTWFWGPALSQRNRVLFRPFILSNFSALPLNAKGSTFDAWKGETAAPLERWLQAVDAADDVELTRRLYGWRLQHTPWKHREDTWRKDVVRRFSSAQSPAARFTALAKVDTGWMSLDAKTAVSLYEIDKAAARSFILSHLPWFGWLGKKRRDWDELLRKSRDQDSDFHFDLYRRIVEEKQWRADVLELCRNVRDAGALDSELERRHPRSHIASAAEVFLEIARARKRDVVPYILRHVSSVSSRWGLMARREAKGLPGLLSISNEEGWLDLWAALLRTAATKELFDAEVKRLVRSTTLPDGDVRMRLSLIAGHGREAHFAGVSLAQVHPLEEDTALELYRRFPELVRGPFRMHIAPGRHHAYPRVVRAAIEIGDTEFIDFLAARAGIQVLFWGEARGWKETIEILTSHFEALPEPEFVRRASNALSRMPAFAVWNYDELLRTNRLARLLFERSTALFLSDANAVRDLLESPQIHVQVLAFRILGRDDARASEVAAQNADLLQAALLRPLHRRTRLLAFKAIENAARKDEAAAGYLLGRMKEALTLPEMRYPTEKLVGLIGNVLYRYPSLRAPGEVPQIYGEADA
jgi:hypothetical protein